MRVVPGSENGIGNDGKLLDYALKMKRLPQELRMDTLLTEGRVSSEQIENIAKIVSNFHSRIDTITERKYSSAKVVKEQIGDLGNFREVINDSCSLGSSVDFVLDKCNSFIEKNSDLFEKRQKEGKIKDCHGDLHSANIFLTDEIVIFDCIEFSKDFRYVDVSSEIAFMAMDLDAFSKEDFSRLFVDKYIDFSGDLEAGRLLGLYKCYRANVRAKIAAIEYSQNPNKDAKERIQKYINLAEKYAKRL